MSWGSVASRESLWKAQRSEGEAMVAVALVDSDNNARWSRGKEAEEGRVLEGERGEVQAGEGSAWRSGTTPAAASRQEVAVRVPACGGHAPWSFWQRKEKTREPLVGWAASWATRWPGRPGKLAQVVLSPSLISVLIWFSIIL